MTMAIATHNVTKSFDGHAAVNKVCLHVDEGSIFGLIGANGAGKSTLLRMMVGLYQPTSGEVTIFGKPIPAKSDPRLYQRIHYIAADASPYSNLRVRDLLSIARPMYQNWNRHREEQLMDAFQLPHKQSIQTLSTGMQMQLRFVIGLSACPDILVLDEALSGLDPLVKRQILQLMVEIASASRMTIVMATHELGDVERIADSVSIMLDGSIVAADGLDDLRDRIREVVCIYEGTMPSWISKRADVLRVQQNGAHLAMTIDSDVTEWVSHLTQLGALHIDVRRLDLTDVFDTFMEIGGHRRDRIHIS